MTAMGQLNSGVDVLLEVLATEHVRYIFGNPGTTELPLMGALAGDDRFHYMLALHESVAAGMADGYAQATGRPSFLNVHTATGLGNAMGNLSLVFPPAHPLWAGARGFGADAIRVEHLPEVGDAARAALAAARPTVLDIQVTAPPAG
jgi:thiamine pyrophosphate-dependent acetolactate synthase large subunit-like protein